MIGTQNSDLQLTALTIANQPMGLKTHRPGKTTATS
jgi:hypothetical protein